MKPAVLSVASALIKEAKPGFISKSNWNPATGSLFSIDISIFPELFNDVPPSPTNRTTGSTGSVVIVTVPHEELTPIA